MKICTLFFLTILTCPIAFADTKVICGQSKPPFSAFIDNAVDELNKELAKFEQNHVVTHVSQPTIVKEGNYTACVTVTYIAR